MNFGKKGLKLASVLMGTMLMGGVLAGCGSQADSNWSRLTINPRHQRPSMRQRS